MADDESGWAKFEGQGQPQPDGEDLFGDNAVNPMQAMAGMSADQQVQLAAMAAQFPGTAGSSEMTRAFSKDTGETAAVLVEPDPPAPDSMIDAGLTELDDEGPMTQERAMLEAEQV